MQSNKNKSIIRVAKNRENPYVMMNKTGLNDSRLSFKAKGILAYLLSKPDNWRVMVCDLINNSTDGKTAIYSGLKELEKYGYLERRRVYRVDEKTNKKVVDYWESIVYEVPIEKDLPLPQNEEVDQSLEDKEIHLLPENQEVGNQEVDNKPLIINEFNNIDINNNNTEETEKTDDVVVENENVIELKKEIEEVTGGHVVEKNLEKILRQPDGEKAIKKTIKTFPAISEAMLKTQEIANPVGLFFYIAENNVKPPVAKNAIGIHKSNNFNNFDQRTYTEEELDHLYEDI